jgi:PKD domain
MAPTNCRQDECLSHGPIASARARCGTIRRGRGWRAAAALAAAAAFGAAYGGATFTDISPDRSPMYQSTYAFGASGGRVNNLAAAPGTNQVFYAASEWGGLWKTQDGGAHWQHLDGHVPMATWDVAVDPLDVNTVYATSLHDGRVDTVAGIEVSRDAGATWTHPASAVPPTTPTGASFYCPRPGEVSGFGIGIRPDAPQNVYVGTTCGIAISHDDGATWTYADPAGAATATAVWDVLARPGGPQAMGIVDACGAGGVFRSTDGGAYWSRHDLPFALYNTGRCSIAASPFEDDVIFVVDDIENPGFFSPFHSVWESDDAGVTWQLLGKPYSPTSNPKRLTFLTTNRRSDIGGKHAFDLWYGEEDIWRVPCVTPNPPLPGSPSRCPVASPQVTWFGPPIGTAPWGEVTRLEEFTGAHGDSGDLEFDRTAPVDACPAIYASDGGVFHRDPAASDCQDPAFLQPDVSPHALWLWGFSGANHPDGHVDLYFACQDDNAWAATDAQTGSPTWTDRGPADSFSIAADVNRVVWVSAANTLEVQGPGMVGGKQVAPPAPLLRFLFLPAVDRYADKSYVIATSAGIYVTSDITAASVAWTQLGSFPGPGPICGVRASVDPAMPNQPVFYVQAGPNCNQALNDLQGDGLYKYVGAGGAGTWQRIDTAYGTGGIGVFGVDRTNPNRLSASNLCQGTDCPRMIFSNDGGATWQRNTALDDRMVGLGLSVPGQPVFRYANATGPTTDYGFNATLPGYPQPSLVAFDPDAPNVIVAGGRDSGVFLSMDGGKNWGTLTDPVHPGQTHVPHLPRPWFAHFQHDATGAIQLYLGTQGRGVWRVTIRPPLAVTGGPYTTDEGSPVTLNASGSSDPDGQALSYAWDLNGDGVFDDATGATAQFDQVGQDGIAHVGVKVTAGGVSSIATTTVTVKNVAPAVSLVSDAPKNEGDVVTVQGVATDPGWLDPLSATIDWGDGSPVAPLAGTLENVPPDATLSFSSSHTYGDNGVFVAKVCATDDDTTTCGMVDLSILNVPPTAVIDTTGTVDVNGIPTYIVHTGDLVPFSARSTDPGSDDLTLSWDWDDGPPAPDRTRVDLVNPPNPDPFPSPSVQPRDVTDTVSHAFPQACVYDVTFRAVDDDQGSHADSVHVIVAGTASATRSAGYWKQQYNSPGKSSLGVPTLTCDLQIVGFMSRVFDEVRLASTFAEASDVLDSSGSKPDALRTLDRQLLAAWLNFADGSLDLSTMVDTDGDHHPDTTFAQAVFAAETVRLDPNATKSQIVEQADILERIN